MNNAATASTTREIKAAGLLPGHVLEVDGATVTRVDVVTVGGSVWIEYATTELPFSMFVNARSKVTIRNA